MAQHPVLPMGSELASAVNGSDIPLALWREPSATVVLVNRPLEELLGRGVAELVGRELPSLVTPRLSVEATIAALSSGLVDAVRTQREVRRPDGPPVPVWVWTRSVDVGDGRVGVSLLVPVGTAASFGRDPAARWRDLLQIGVGTTDPEWRIVHVSTEVEDMTGFAARDLAGRQLFDLLHIPPAPALLTTTEMAPVDVPAIGRVERADGQVAELGLLVSSVCCDPPVAVFALLAQPSAAPVGLQDRVRELELRLERIGAEVRAAGILDEVGAAAYQPLPTMSGLTSRQWEILIRLLHGERVPGIASALFVSQSTVRNHLAALFRRFGVHSQAELIALLR